MLPAHLAFNPEVTQRAVFRDGVDGRHERTEFASGYERKDKKGARPPGRSFVTLVKHVIADIREKKKEAIKASTKLTGARAPPSSASTEARRNLETDNAWDARREEDRKLYFGNLAFVSRLKYADMEREETFVKKMFRYRPLMRHSCLSDLFFGSPVSKPFICSMRLEVYDCEFELFNSDVLPTFFDSLPGGLDAHVKYEYKDTIMYHSEYYSFEADLPTITCQKCHGEMMPTAHDVNCWPSSPTSIIPRGDPHGNLTHFFKTSILVEYKGLRYGGAYSMEAYAAQLVERQKIMLNVPMILGLPRKYNYKIVNIDSRVLQNTFVSFMRASFPALYSNLTLSYTGESHCFGIVGSILDCPSHGTLFSVSENENSFNEFAYLSKYCPSPGDASTTPADASMDTLMEEDRSTPRLKYFHAPRTEFITDACTGLNELKNTACAKRLAGHKPQIGLYFSQANREEQEEYEVAKKAMESVVVPLNAASSRSLASRSLVEPPIIEFEDLDEHNELRCAIPDIKQCSSGHAKGMALGVCDDGYCFRNSAMSLPRGEWFGVFDKMLFHVVLNNEIDCPGPVILDYGCIYQVHLCKKFEGLELSGGRSITDVGVMVDVLHAKGHIPSCRFTNGMLYINGSGRVSGVQAERAWSRVRVLGPGGPLWAPRWGHCL